MKKLTQMKSLSNVAFVKNASKVKVTKKYTREDTLEKNQMSVKLAV